MAQMLSPPLWSRLKYVNNWFAMKHILGPQRMNCGNIYVYIFSFSFNSIIKLKFEFVQYIYLSIKLMTFTSVSICYAC